MCLIRVQYWDGIDWVLEMLDGEPGSSGFLWMPSVGIAHTPHGEYRPPHSYVRASKAALPRNLILPKLKMSLAALVESIVLFTVTGTRLACYPGPVLGFKVIFFFLVALRNQSLLHTVDLSQRCRVDISRRRSTFLCIVSNNLALG